MAGESSDRLGELRWTPGAHRLQETIFWLASILLFSVDAAYALQQPDESDPATLLKKVSRVYEAWRTACLNGDVEGFIKSRDPEEIDRLLERLGRQLTSEDISFGAEAIAPIDKLVFIDLAREDGWIQARFHGGDAEPDAAGERVRFHILLFRRHPDGWKLAIPGSVAHRKFAEDGTEFTIQDIEIPDRMRLPQQREEA